MTASQPAIPEHRVLIPPLQAAEARQRPGPDAARFQLGGTTMGTTWRAVFYAAPAAARLPALETAIEAELDLVIRQMSPWEPQSDLMRFNAAPAGHWQVLPEPFFTVLQAALDLARRTDGRYDPTLGRQIDLWGFGPSGSRTSPPTGNHPSAPRDGWRHLTLDTAGRRALQPGGIALDLCSIAKGHAVDRMSDVLRQAGIASHLVEIGGDMLGRGVKPDGTPWWAVLEAPPGPRAADTIAALCGQAIAGSGNYRRFYEHDGTRYCHALDGRTGQPVAHDLAAVSVIAESCMTADALATALFVLGPEDGPAFAARHDIAAAFHKADPAAAPDLTPAMAAMAGDD